MTAASPFERFDLPPLWREPLLDRIAAHNASAGTRLVVLDDDPLGGQCLHDVPVLTTWDVDALTAELRQSSAFLLLANTRALPRAAAIERARAVGAALRAAERTAGVTVTPIWRSDSTLRGHYWHEMRAFDTAFRPEGAADPVYVFLPYFGDGGRYTISETQYVLNEHALIPAADTEFARDPAFAFEHSHLPSWLEAHSDGRLPASEVICISLDDLRAGGPDRIAALLSDAHPGSAVVVNATDDRDLEVFTAGLQQSETRRRFLCSGAAPFIRVRTGIEVRPLLTAGVLGLEGSTGGLTVVSSYVDKTSEQLGRALQEPGIVAIEMAAPRTHAVPPLPDGLSEHLAAGRDVIIHTHREHVAGAAPALAEALVRTVSSLRVRPRYLLIKGGSSASALATDALGVRRAIVLGQLLPGVPVWRLGEESRWPGLPVVIFAGNVGTSDSLAQAIRTLRND